MFYILSSSEYSAFLVLSDIKPNNISQAKFNVELSKGDLSQGKNELAKIGLVKKKVISQVGKVLAQAILRPQKVISVVSSNSLDMATTHYCFNGSFWIRLLPDFNHNIISIESPILNQDIGKKINEDFFVGIEVEEVEEINLKLSLKELLIFEMMQLEVIDRIKKKEAPLTKEESQLYSHEFINKKNLLTLAASSISLGAEEGYEISKVLWDLKDSQQHLATLVSKEVFDSTRPVYAPRTKFSLSEKAQKWLSADTIIDKITMQKLPEGDILNFTITKAGMLEVIQEKNSIIFKSMPKSYLD